MKKTSQQPQMIKIFIKSWEAVTQKYVHTQLCLRFYSIKNYFGKDRFILNEAKLQIDRKNLHIKQNKKNH